MYRRSAKGFTLIEVLVVVAIIALLVSILLPSLASAREQASILVCKTRMEQLFKGHNFYAYDNKGHFPDPDWWLWDGENGSMRQWFPNLYGKTGGVRPTDSRRWVEFGHIYRYVKDKEVYFCPKDSRRRTGNSIGAGGSLGSYPIHSFVRFFDLHQWMSIKWGAADTIPHATSSLNLHRSDFLRVEMLRNKAVTWYEGSTPKMKLNSTPNRMGLLFEELQNYDEPPGMSAAPNKGSALNDAYSGWHYYTDWPSWRHSKNRSHVLFWDGHISLVDAARVYKDPDGFGAWTSIGGPAPK